MNIETLDNPDQTLIEFLDKKIAEFNWANWEVNERLPLAIQVKNESGQVVAGAAGRSFGDWLMLNTLWVSEELRGQDIGSKVLNAFETSGRERGCIKCILDTLNFQAKPFYEKHGYKVVWTQQGYPKTGCKYYMVKAL